MKTTILVGPPGTGKSTTIGRIVERAIADANGDPSPVCVLSMTRAAAGEAMSKTGGSLDKSLCSTIHKAAILAIGDVKLADGKESEFNDAHPVHTVSKDGKDGTSGDTAKQLYDLYRSQLHPRERWPTWMAGWVKAWEGWKRDTERMDFGDVIEAATDLWHSRRPTHIIVDEAQDISRAELKLLHNWATQARKLTLVGDPYQAIYKWRGAYPEMFHDHRFERTVLDQSYRIPLAVQTKAVNWCSKISTYEPFDYRPAPHDGECKEIPDDYQRLDCIPDFIEECIEDGQTFMLAAPCDYMLAPIIRHLRSSGIPFANPWATDRGDWNPIGGRGDATTTVDRIMALLIADAGLYGGGRKLWTNNQVRLWSEMLRIDDTMNIGARKQLADKCKADPEWADRRTTEAELREWFKWPWFEKLWAIFIARNRGNTPTLMDLKRFIRSACTKQYVDRLDYPFAVLERCGVQGIAQKPSVYVGTIHSFKGAEADTVALVPDLSKSFYREYGDDTIRLGYVGMTRAKHRLLLMDAATKMRMEW